MRLLLFAAAIFLQNVPATMPAKPPIPALPTRQWIQDMQTKNLEDVLALYTPDAVFVDPTGKQFSTPADLRKLYEQVFATYDSDLTRGKGNLAIQGNPQTAGSIAVESASFTEALRTRATNTTAHLCGDYRFTFILQQDGKWLISRMEWTSKPCPATTN